ncbi:MAG: M42 family metallopeptidase [Candidatus Cloacimonadota bacterium]|nr:M42 family metallopeptidase [Candidatus Cloacimonadota bacterium]
MDYKKILHELTLLPGISGDEERVAKYIESKLSANCKFSKDNMGNVFCEYSGENDFPKIMFIAHMDEVGFIVSDIHPDGFIKFHNIGGWNPNTLLSSPVEVINSKGDKFHGIIGSIPKHFKVKEKKLDISDMFIDVGAVSAEDLKQNFGIEIGDAIVPVANYSYCEKSNRMLSKAFDDRIGVAAMIALGEKLTKMQHKNTVILTGSVQEEVGTRGSSSIANRTDADICIVLEGAPADDIPGIPGNPQTAVGKGAHVRVFDPTMIVKSSLKKFIKKIANENNICFQTTVRKGGGTDGRNIHLANMGIPSIVLGCPVRYAHSHNSLISLDDFEELLKLITVIVENINKETVAQILA